MIEGRGRFRGNLIVAVGLQATDLEPKGFLVQSLGPAKDISYLIIK